MITATCEDNMQMMARYPDKYFDLAIVDPQTGQGEGSKHNSRPYSVKQKDGSVKTVKRTHRLKDWDGKPPSQNYYNELFRVSRHQIIMCENYLHFEQKRNSEGRIIWNLLRENDFSACQIMWTSLFRKIVYFEYLWSGMMQGVAINSRRQIGDKSKNQKRIHPSEKPIIVYKHILNEYAQRGWSILDTHNGSGAINIACHDLGFDLTACEKDRDNYNDAMKRLEQHQKQLKLFSA